MIIDINNILTLLLTFGLVVGVLVWIIKDIKDDVSYLKKRDLSTSRLIEDLITKRNSHNETKTLRDGTKL
jgi:hypothetical protein